MFLSDFIKVSENKQFHILIAIYDWNRDSRKKQIFIFINNDFFGGINKNGD